MITREKWQAQTKVIRDMAELIWQASIPFEEEGYHNAHKLGVECRLWEQQLMMTYREMIDMADDRDCEDEDYPTEAERALSALKDAHSSLGARREELGLPNLTGGAS